MSPQTHAAFLDIVLEGQRARERHGELRRRALPRAGRGDPPLPDCARPRRLGGHEPMTCRYLAALAAVAAPRRRAGAGRGRLRPTYGAGPRRDRGPDGALPVRDRLLRLGRLRRHLRRGRRARVRQRQLEGPRGDPRRGDPLRRGHRPLLPHRGRQAGDPAPRDPADRRSGSRATAPGAARCGSRWPTTAPGDEPKIGTYGIYEDEFRKVDGRWLIARRNVLNEFIPNRSSGPENPVAEMDALAEAAKYAHPARGSATEVSLRGGDLVR